MVLLSYLRMKPTPRKIHLNNGKRDRGFMALFVSLEPAKPEAISSLHFLVTLVNKFFFLA